MAVSKREVETPHGRLTALEALMIMVPSDSGPDALHQAIKGIDKQFRRDAGGREGTRRPQDAVRGRARLA